MLRIASAAVRLVACALFGLALAAAGGLTLFSAPAVQAAEPFDYRLTPRRIAEDTWLLEGLTEDFSPANGGNIVNVAFIATGDGVLVIDSGPTKRYGEALRAAIAQVTDQPLREVWLTHHHPDHVLGNQAFADVPIGALPATAHGLRDEGEAFAANVYRLVGDWARGTEVQPVSRELAPGTRQFGRHRFRLLALAGHTASDLAILDETTGVLFAGDLLFHHRAPTTPHADITQWLAALDTLQALPARVVVPGHGPVAGGEREGNARDQPFEQTRRWLRWLRDTLRRAADAGLDPQEVLAEPLPPEFATLPLARQELARSLAHLYRRLEAGALQSR